MTRICDSTLCARMMLTARSLSTRYASGGFLLRWQSQLVVWRRVAKRRTPVNAVVTCILVEVLTTFDHFRSWSMLAGSRMTYCCVRVFTGRHPPSMKSSALTRAFGHYVGFEYADKTSSSSSDLDHRSILHLLKCAKTCVFLPFPFHSGTNHVQ